LLVSSYANEPGYQKLSLSKVVMDFQIIAEAFVLMIFRISKSVKQLYFFYCFSPNTFFSLAVLYKSTKKIDLPAFRRFPMQAVTPHLLISKNVGILVTQGERIA
jgi:hypothetical protein